MQVGNYYEEARRQFFEVEPRPLRTGDAPLPSREEIHDRSQLFTDKASGATRSNLRRPGEGESPGGV